MGVRNLAVSIELGRKSAERRPTKTVSSPSTMKIHLQLFYGISVLSSQGRKIQIIINKEIAVAARCG
jgi:hypothetical protein